MKRLLHERLRKSVNSLDPASTWTIMGTLPLFPGQIIAIADEIERCYVPIPRFEDGEPVREGSETRYGTVEYISVEVSSGGWGNWVLHMKDGNYIEGTLSQRVEHPAPKVLGADGLPIEVGETVWHMESGNKFDVRCLNPFEVVGFGGVSSTWFKPEEFTHREPDSQERIDKDIIRSFGTYWGCRDASSCNECPSKIGGKKPYERYACDSCVSAKMFDLLRRQRELDARKGGAE